MNGVPIGHVAIAIVLALVANANAQQRPVSLNVIRIEPVGEGDGRALQLEGFHHVGSPTFSKDGQWIAFDGYKADAADVISECWVVRSDGTQPRRVARGATPRWSPDGKKLLFMREEREDLGRPGGEEIGVFVIGADGKGEQRLLDGRWPDWSPDGTKIACCFNDPALGAPMIRVIDLVMNEQKLVGYGWVRANWSANGKSLYADGVVNRNRPGMVRLSAEKRSEPEAILTKFVGQSPCPSPNGNEIVFCTIPEGAGGVQ